MTAPEPLTEPLTEHSAVLEPGTGTGGTPAAAAAVHPDPSRPGHSTWSLDLADGDNLPMDVQFDEKSARRLQGWAYDLVAALTQLSRDLDAIALDDLDAPDEKVKALVEKFRNEVPVGESINIGHQRHQSIATVSLFSAFTHDRFHLTYSWEADRWSDEEDDGIRVRSAKGVGEVLASTERLLAFLDVTLGPLPERERLARDHYRAHPLRHGTNPSAWEGASNMRCAEVVDAYLAADALIAARQTAENPPTNEQVAADAAAHAARQRKRFADHYVEAYVADDTIGPLSERVAALFADHDDDGRPEPRQMTVLTWYGHQPGDQRIHTSLVVDRQARDEGVAIRPDACTVTLSPEFVSVGFSTERHPAGQNEADVRARMQRFEAIGQSPRNATLVRIEGRGADEQNRTNRIHVTFWNEHQVACHTVVAFEALGWERRNRDARH